MHLDGSRICRDLSSTNSQQINLSRCYREFVYGKNALMDRKAAEKLSANRNFLDGSRICRDKFQKASMDRRCDKNYREKKSKGLDRQLFVEIYRDAVELDQKAFQVEEKHRNECNQANYSTKDPNNTLSSQKHLSTRKCKEFMIQNTHAH